MRLALDTNRYTDLCRGDAQVRAILEGADEILLPLPVLAELRAGFAHGSRRAANERVLAEFLAQDGVSFDEHIGPMKSNIDDLVDRAPGGEIAFDAGMHRYVYRGNWKLQVENVLDSYHVPFSHASTVSRDGTQFARREGDEKGTKVIAEGEWSKPVDDNRGYAVRGRLVLCEKFSGDDLREVAVYVELHKLASCIFEDAKEIPSEEERKEYDSAADRCSVFATSIERWLNQDLENQVYWVEQRGERHKIAMASAPIELPSCFTTFISEIFSSSGHPASVMPNTVDLKDPSFSLSPVEQLSFAWLWHLMQ